MFCEESFGLELFRNGSVLKFGRLKALITLKRVNTSVVGKKKNKTKQKQNNKKKKTRILGCVPLRWSRSGSVIRDHSDHGRTNEPMNPRSFDLPWSEWSWIYWFWSGSSQRNAPLISKILTGRVCCKLLWVKWVLWWAYGLFSAMIEIMPHVLITFFISGNDAIPVVANTRTKSIQKHFVELRCKK